MAYSVFINLTPLFYLQKTRVATYANEVAVVAMKSKCRYYHFWWNKIRCHIQNGFTEIKKLFRLYLGY